MELVVIWLRAHNVTTGIDIQFDGGGEFCSASLKKTVSWNSALSKYSVRVYNTGGVKWEQNLVKRTHQIDNEKFYCPQEEFINSKKDFMLEAQLWLFYYNN